MSNRARVVTVLVLVSVLLAVASFAVPYLMNVNDGANLCRQAPFDVPAILKVDVYPPAITCTFDYGFSVTTLTFPSGSPLMAVIAGLAVACLAAALVLAVRNLLKSRA